MFLVGLTGGIATGKSTVVTMLRSMGVEVIDSDVIAREVVEPGKKAWKSIKKEFGDTVLHSDGTLNRPALGAIVFSDPGKRKILNSITHPEIYKSILCRCLRLFVTGHQFSVLDLPLLYESGKMVKYLHKVVVITCGPSQQLERLMLRDNIPEKDALLRINAQMPLTEKCCLADYVIDNSRNKDYTKAQVEAAVEEFKGSYAHWKLRLILLSGLLLVGGTFAIGIWQSITFLKIYCF